MISINAKIIEDLFASEKVRIDNQIALKKAQLYYFQNNPTHSVNRVQIPLELTPNQINYLTLLYNEFEKIVKAKPSTIDDFRIAFDGIIPGTQMKSIANIEFRNELIKRLGYSELRDNFYPEYFEKTGIKTCVYCNSQLALTVRIVGGPRKAKFQIDHYYPKSEYPCFSISFYNLYPVCGPCNNSKSASQINFNLYSDNWSEYSKS